LEKLFAKGDIHLIIILKEVAIRKNILSTKDSKGKMAIEIF